MIVSVTMGCVVTEDMVRERLHITGQFKEHLARMLRSDIGIPQRTPEWYVARESMITASDFAQALDLGKFGSRKELFEKKCGHVPPRAFDATCPPLRWGVMFEPVACNIYSALNAYVHIHEFGLLRHPDPRTPFLGASPDGISENGIMIEIKCPWRRRIDGTVPLQYYLQIQGQLSVTGLRECDYFEVEFEELRDEASVISEFSDEHFLTSTEFSQRSIMRGVIIETIGEVTTYVYNPPGGKLADLRVFISENTKDTEHTQNVVWWRVRKHGTIKIIADPELNQIMIRKLGNVWWEILRLRGDRQAYDSAVAKTTPNTRLVSTSKKSINNAKIHIALEEPVPSYAFVD
jgi:putative phage-type endonuclease